MGNSTGTKYYYDKGYVRIRIKLGGDDVQKLKRLAIEKYLSTAKLVQQAFEWMVNNKDKIPVEFPPPPDGQFFYSYIPKEVQKAIKTQAIDIKAKACDLMGFMLQIWIQADGKIEED